MIDYEKLKVAHDLCKQYSKLSTHMLGIEIVHYNDDSIGIFLNGASTIGFSSLDDLITKLQELTQPKPKYEVGQEVWYTDENRALSAKIVFVGDGEYKIDDSINRRGKDWFTEDELYPTREALIEAQIAYWEGLRGEQRLKVPYTDYKGNDIYVGDVLTHPVSKESFKVVYDLDRVNPWRAVYANGESLFLGHQVSDKGMASKECQHQWDAETFLRFSDKNKCKKCGEFY